jgi:hypothetical protein
LLRNKQREFAEALETRDLDKLPSFYAADATLSRPGGHVVRGRINIADWMQRHPDEATSVVLDTQHFDTYGGAVSGRFSQHTGTSPRVGEYAIVWKLVDEQWLIAADVFSAIDTRP